MCLNLLLCYSAVRWKSVISRRVKIYKSTVGKREKKNVGDRRREGERKVREGRRRREINTIHRPREGKFRPSLFHESLRKVDDRRFKAPLQSLWRETRYLLHTRISKCRFFFFFFSRAAVRPAVRLSFPASASPQRCLSAVPCCRLLA